MSQLQVNSPFWPSIAASGLEAKPPSAASATAVATRAASPGLPRLVSFTNGFITVSSNRSAFSQLPA